MSVEKHEHKIIQAMEILTLLIVSNCFGNRGAPSRYFEYIKQLKAHAWSTKLHQILET